MKLLHYVEIENFKRYGDIQRIDLDHPAVLIGPNNCGKTSALQAIALWSSQMDDDAAGQTWPGTRHRHCGGHGDGDPDGPEHAGCGSADRGEGDGFQAGFVGIALDQRNGDFVFPRL